MTIDADNSKLAVTCSQEFPESYANKILPEYILEKVKRFKDEGKDAWVIDSVTGESHYYSDFEEHTKRVASAFYKKGLRKGDIVIFMPYDMANLQLFFVGVWRANGAVRAMYPEEDEDTLLLAIEESRAGWIYCDPEQAEMCLKVASSERIYWNVEIIITHGKVEGCIPITDLFEDDGLELPTLTVSPKDPALLLCTSGTTGRSKAAVHTHETVIATIILCGLIPWSLDKPNLLLSKATHISGSVFSLVILCKGGISIVMAHVKKDNMFKAVHDYKPTVIFAFPTLLLQLANDPEGQEYDLSSVEVTITGGAHCTPPMVDTIMQLPNMKSVIPIWGLTEVVPLTIALNYDDINSGLLTNKDIPEFTVGKPPPGVEIQCRDVETGDILGHDQKGELCAKAPCMFTSYFLNERATREAFVDGYFKTGDVGYYDVNGYIFLIDRIKEIFKYRGNHISPTEIEEVISRHEAVLEVCVVGTPDPEGRGYFPRAFITKRNGFENATAEEIKQFADDHLAEYKRLQGGLFIMDSLPKGKTGKITRNLVEKIEVP